MNHALFHPFASVVILLHLLIYLFIYLFIYIFIISIFIYHVSKASLQLIPLVVVPLFLLLHCPHYFVVEFVRLVSVFAFFPFAFPYFRFGFRSCLFARSQILLQQIMKQEKNKIHKSTKEKQHK
jgi:hypothetical protein